MPPRFRIGVNAVDLIPGASGDAEIYARNLLAELAEIDQRNHYLVFVNREMGPDLCPRVPNFAPVETGINGGSGLSRWLWQQATLPRETFWTKIDVLLNFGCNGPRRHRGANVVWLEGAEHRARPNRFSGWRRRMRERNFARAVQAADRIALPSEAAKAQIVSEYPAASDKTRVFPYGLEPAWHGIADDHPFGSSSPLKEPYLLASFSGPPDENWKTFLEAFQDFLKDGPALELAVWTPGGSAWEKAREDLAGTVAGARAHILSGQPAAARLDWVRFAEAFALPALHEPFGLHALEAMAAGLPIACADLPSLHELAGDSAVYFDAASRKDTAEALSTLMRDGPEREERVSQGRERSRRYRWRATAERMLETFLDVVKR